MSRKPVGTRTFKTWVIAGRPYSIFRGDTYVYTGTRTVNVMWVLCDPDSVFMEAGFSLSRHAALETIRGKIPVPHPLTDYQNKIGPLNNRLTVRKLAKQNEMKIRDWQRHCKAKNDHERARYGIHIMKVIHETD